MNDGWNNDPGLMGPDFMQMGTTMSQVVSKHAESVMRKDYKERLFNIVKEDQLSTYYAENVYPSRELIFL